MNSCSHISNLKKKYKLITDSAEKASAFMNDFQMFFTTDNGVLPATNLNYSPVNITPDFSAQHAAKYLCIIIASAAAGLDNLPSKFWKSMHLALSVPLLIYNVSFSSCKLPSIWKLSYINSVFKNSDSANFSCS